ncbi:MAG: DUF202 domain-containing protein [Gallionellaceae bacterium]|nr:MAG: DUF202 domain-containing protein [Gallionellaceae bacterium]
MSDLNDPRVFFAAGRTLFAWNRTSLVLMAFGFAIEWFGLFVHILLPEYDALLQRGLSFRTGLIFVLSGAFVAAYSTVRYRTDPGVISNLIVAILGIVLTVYFFRGV